ncbi:MAG: hypothetical protein GXO89_10870 [Chlorobi bacterium]|nr:hypothetical protein [Chlorobiota bacterium]
MSFNKYSSTFLFSLLIIITWSCWDSKWKGQDAMLKVNTQIVPIQEQVKKTYDLGKGIYSSNEFAGARLNGMVLSNDTLITALITPENTPINQSPWYAFKIWSENQQDIYLKLTYLFGVKHRYYPKLSHDGINWQRLDSANYILGSIEKKKNDRLLPDDITMKISIGPDTLWISAQELLTSKNANTWMESLAKKPFVSMEQIATSHQGRAINMLKIGNADDKKMILVLSRQHPPEVSGYLAMQSFVEVLAGESETATKFREMYNTYVVPMMNPDGVDNGHWRTNAQGVDLNRDWQEFNQPETSAIRDFMQKKVLSTGGNFYLGIDFHSTFEDIYYTIDPELKGNMPGLVNTLIDSMSLLIGDPEPNIRPRSDDEVRISSRTFFFFEFGAEALVYEVGDETPRDLLKRKGEVAALKMMEFMVK